MFFSFIYKVTYLFLLKAEVSCIFFFIPIHSFLQFSCCGNIRLFTLAVAFDVVKFLSLLCTNRFYGSGLVSLCLCNAFPQGILGEFNLGRRILQLSLRLRQL